MPGYPGGKYGADMAERGGHVPSRAAKESQMPKGQEVGMKPAKMIPMPEPSVEQVMGMSNHKPKVTGNESQVAKGSHGKGPAKKVAMKEPSAGKEVG